MFVVTMIRSMTYSYPTTAQAFKCIALCQSLSDLGRDIVLFRYNPILGTIFILTATELQIVIRENGDWRFEDET